MTFQEDFYVLSFLLLYFLNNVFEVWQIKFRVRYKIPTTYKLNFPHACGELSVFGIHYRLVKTNPVNDENKNELVDLK